MKTLIKSAALAGLMLSAGTTAAHAQAAAAASGPVVAGIAVANLDAVIANSNAFRTAQQQRQGTAQCAAQKSKHGWFYAEIVSLLGQTAIKLLG